MKVICTEIMVNYHHRAFLIHFVILIRVVSLALLNL